MKRLLSSLVLAGCFLTSTSLPLIPHQYRELAQAQTADELFYTFYGQKIPLSQQQIAAPLALLNLYTCSYSRI
jgi:serine protease